MMSFVIGQRWISDTESDLGLGLIYAFDQRTVTLYFPAIGESRVYSRENPPITRIIFADDDTITSFEGWDMRITGHQEDNGIITYLGQRSDYPEQTVELNEKHIDSKMSYSKPQLRLFSGQIDRNDHYAMRYRANLYRQRQFSNPDSGLCGMRTSLIPHQLYIANEVAHRHAPRVLLADEVGLGKTIEAGMIIHQRLLSGSSERVLIIVPSSLQHQWLVEMLRRFNLYFSLFDEERLNEALLDDIHAPFDTEQLVICSLDFVTQETRRLNYLLKSHWDLLVVDEAHHLQWSPEAPSEQYTAIEHLANHIPAILLLTATPEQLGLESHFARLRLLDPARFHDYVEFLKEQDQFKVIADAVDSLLAQTNLTDEQCNSLTELISEQDIEPLLQSANSDSDDRKQARAQLTKILMDRHGTSRILFRNTRQAIKGFPTRNLHQIKLPLPTEYQSLIEFTQNMSHDDISAKSVRLQLFPEQLYLTFNSKSEIPWYDIDPRVNWVINHLLQHRDKKILIICHLSKTALALEQALREKEGIKATVFHEGLSILERDRAAAYFASQEEGAQVMICSEIGSEGRNFQFSHTMIMFDLPLNPDLLEQRIGRLDRIGQCHDIDIYVPYLENSAQAALLRWYEESLNAFESTCPTGIILFDHYFETLLPFISGMLSKEKRDNFISQCQQHHLQLKQQLESGRDRLLELNSNGGELALQLAERIDENDDDKELEIFSQQLFNLIGLHQNDDKDGLINLIPSSDMLIPDFPGIPEDGCTISFERQQALSLEDTQFITWEHPIIRHGIDLLVSGDIGRCSVSLLKNKSLPVGTLLIELIYILNVQAPKSLQLQRFLPPTPLRLLLDASGRNLANNVDFEKLHQQLTPIKRNLATNIAKTVRTQVEVIIEKAEKTVQPLAQTCIDEAKSKAEQSLHEELSRLQSLKAVNPSIRDDEITAIEENLTDVLEHLEQANWYLDSLRLIVVSHQ